MSDSATGNAIPLLRNSERSDFKRCPLRWWWRYQDQLVPINFTTGPLLFGSLGHLALASWYVPGKKRGVEPQETWAALTKELWDAVKVESKYIDDDIEATWEDARELGDAMLANYRKKYGTDDDWEVLWTENQFHQKITDPRDLRRAQRAKQAGQTHKGKPLYPPIVEYVGTIDLIIRNLATGDIEYVDHKFMKTIQVDHLYIDDQNGGYLSIGTRELRNRGLIGPKEAVRVLVYNFLRKALPPDTPMNADGKYCNQPQKKHYQEAIRAKLQNTQYWTEDVQSWLPKASLPALKEHAAALNLTVLGDPSQRQPSPFFHRERIERTGPERNRQIERIAQEALVIQQFRDRKLPIVKTPSPNCTWDCQFFDLCQIHESGDGDLEFAKKAMFRQEDPYAEYYIGAESPKIMKDR